MLPRAARGVASLRLSRTPHCPLGNRPSAAASQRPRFLDVSRRCASSSPGSDGPASSSSSAGRPDGGRVGNEKLIEEVDESGHKASDDAGEVKPGDGDNMQYTFRSAIFTCAVAAGCLGYFDYVKRKKEDESRCTIKHERIGTPKLGGPFELRDRKGVVRTDEDYKGQYLLIYFGFTMCPDICPQEMEKQTHAIELIEKEFGPVATPVFISIDPKRDTVEQVDDYCKEFHPRIEGLTGTKEQVKKVSRAYRVYYNEGIKTDEEDYLIDHSIIHYFVNRKGKFVDFFGKNMTAKEMADKMKAQILDDKAKANRRKSQQGVAGDDDE